MDTMNETEVVELVAGFIDQYLYFAHRRHSEVVAKYIIDTWRGTRGKRHVSYLLFSSVVHASGLTRAGKVVSAVVREPFWLHKATQRAALTVMDERSPTVIVDKSALDLTCAWSDSDDDSDSESKPLISLLSLLECGFDWDCKILQTINRQVKAYEVFGHKILIFRNPEQWLSPKILAHCIKIPLEPASLDVAPNIPLVIRPEEFEAKAAEVREVLRRLEG